MCGITAEGRRTSTGRPHGPAIWMGLRNVSIFFGLGWDKSRGSGRNIAAPRPVDAQLDPGMVSADVRSIRSISFEGRNQKGHNNPTVAIHKPMY